MLCIPEKTETFFLPGIEFLVKCFRVSQTRDKSPRERRDISFTNVYALLLLFFNDDDVFIVSKEDKEEQRYHRYEHRQKKKFFFFFFFV